jgi:glycerol kinase
MQLQANLLGRPVKRLKVHELSAFGAGVLAGAAAGLMDEAKVEADLKRSSSVLVPNLDEGGREAKVGVWKAAVRSVIDNTVVR